MDEIVCQTSHVQTDRCRSSCCGCSHTPVSNAIIRLTESIGTSEESPAFSRTRGAVGPRTHSQCNFELSARRIYIRVAGQPQFGTRGKTQVDGPSHTECALGTSLPPRGPGDLRQLPGVGRTTVQPLDPPGRVLGGGQEVAFGRVAARIGHLNRTGFNGDSVV